MTRRFILARIIQVNNYIVRMNNEFATPDIECDHGLDTAGKVPLPTLPATSRFAVVLREARYF